MMIPAGYSMGSQPKTQSVRRYFSLENWVSNVFAKVLVGFVFALPITIIIFSKTLALFLAVLLVISYCIGTIIAEFDLWYNRSRMRAEENEPIPEGPLTELEIILRRLNYFENKYITTIQSMYRWLEADKVPFENLDWLEMVSLLNKLSLYIGKRFDREDRKKGKNK